MKVIGITGGIGAGKSALLAYIGEQYNCQVILADEVAHRLKEPGEECYDKLIALLGKDILNPDGTIARERMAERIFADKNCLTQVNRIIHPAVKEFIRQKIAEGREEDRLDFLFVEAALLIEGGYEQIVDELWYIAAKDEIRRERLKRTRSYSDEKIDSILKEQLSEEAYRQHCSVVIDNSKSFTEACKQVDEKLEEYLCQR